MAFKYKILPTNLHFKKLNEEIDLTNSPFEILKDNIKWDHVSNRVAGISSFGFGGSNAHIVVSEPDHRISNQNNKTQSIQDNYHIVVISARTERSFKKYLKKLHDFLINIKISKKQYNLKDIAYTLATGRTHFEYRAAWIVNSLENLIQLTEQPSDFSLVKKSKFIKNFGQHKTKYVNLDEIRLSFLKGEFINWNELYKSQNVKKAHLPTYVFDSLF